MAKLNWQSMVASLRSMDEDEVKDLLDEELTKHKRPAIARRLHQRYSALRTQRERKAILERIKS